ncbi:hypothetical protein PV728_29780 [Streptomyces europaeiscabiei]|uniref:hypothetical protein n=1 Tax=Streptomyces TaxID=1883 RepID=UPI000A38C8D4|nr:MULTISPECIES: hypothetical protein [Streptomyces]MDX3634383.1 hypothetical protein [Streptomyces europaeiscabiei]MDX3653461.1 hypothetical protein [Streptomyces europaeiscabiei]
MDHQFAVLTDLSDVPSPPAPDRLRISGCSAVVYFAHRLAEGTDFSRVFASGDLRDIDDDRAYQTKVRPDSGLVYSALFDCGPLPAALARVVGSNHAAVLRQAAVSLGGEYVLTALPLLLSVPGPITRETPAIELTAPLTTDTLLRFVSLLGAPDITRTLGEQSARSLARAASIAPGDIERTWAVEGSVAMQVWNLDGTQDRATSSMYAGVEESAKYSWEIAALLSYATDHLLEDGLWLRRSPQNVFGHVRTGMAFFDDHMVFVNSECCLEMAHLPAWLRGRSQFRLSQYGYDSSSIFVWTVGILRRVVCEDLNSRYRRVLADLSMRTEISPAEQSLMTRRRVRHAALLDKCVAFREKLIEGRNRSLDEWTVQERPSGEVLATLNRDMEKCEDVSLSLLRVREDQEKGRRDSLIAVMGIVLAAVQIPSFVEQVADWLQGRRWILLGVSALLIVVPLVVLLRVRRHRSW